jgi:predicted transcriptional regulator
MKAVQIMFDEDLLARLDDTADVREKGRSAVLR